MSEHTPIPWIAYIENLGHGHYGQIKLVTQKHLDENLAGIGEIKLPHDANFIVLAVNAHDALVAACEELVDIMGGLIEDCQAAPYDSFTLQPARAALKLAKGETQ